MGVCSCSLTHKLARENTYAKTTYMQKKHKQVQKSEPIEKRHRWVGKDGDTLSLFTSKDFAKSDDGEMIRAVTTQTVTVKARLRVIPERMGKVDIDFIVTIPKALQKRSYGVIISPILHRDGTIEKLEELAIRGTLMNAIQERDHWQVQQYKRQLLAMEIDDSARVSRMATDLIRYPYPKNTRLDSVVDTKESIEYHYTQVVSVGEYSKRMLVTVGGRVVAVDESKYLLPTVDTLRYNISSMLTFIDTTSRYVTKIVDKYTTVQNRNHLSFKVNNTDIIDTLGNNHEQLTQIKTLMQSIITQDEFLIDSIILTSSSSPEGAYSHNRKLATKRAESLSEYLYKEIDPGIDTLMTIRPIAEDWDELKKHLLLNRKHLKNVSDINKLIANTKDYDALELSIRRRYPNDYRYIREHIYPKLRSVTFRYALRRKGMVKDTIRTTELDTIYARGVEHLKARRYAKALYDLNSYQDQNAAVAMLSLGKDVEALNVLKSFPPTATNHYLLAIVYTRLKRYKEGRIHYDQSCQADPQMEFRGNLDPEILELLKY